MAKHSTSLATYMAEKAVTRWELCTQRFFVLFFLFMWMQASARFSGRALLIALGASLLATIVICWVELYASRPRSPRESA